MNKSLRNRLQLQRSTIKNLSTGALAGVAAGDTEDPTSGLDTAGRGACHVSDDVISCVTHDRRECGGHPRG